MKITDIIRSVLDIVDSGDQEAPNPRMTGIGPEIEIGNAHDCEMEPVMPTAFDQMPQEPDLLAVIQQLAGLEPEEAGYANEPEVIIAPLEASFPAGDDMHHSKNPADIRTNAPSMYPGYQASK